MFYFLRSQDSIPQQNSLFLFASAQIILSSDYLVDLCRQWFTKSLYTALELSKSETFNTDTIPAAFFEKLLGNDLKNNGWHKVVKNWLQGGGEKHSTLCNL